MIWMLTLLVIVPIALFFLAILLIQVSKNKKRPTGAAGLHWKILGTSLCGLICGVVSWVLLQIAVDQFVDDSLLKELYWLFYFLTLPLFSVFYSTIFFWFLIWRSSPTKDTLTIVFISLYTQVLVAVATFLLFIALIFWGDMCNDNVLARAHLFNGHIKSLCLERDDGECPKDIKELAAFNPKAFAELKKKARVEYQRSSNLGYTFTVNYCGGSTLEFSGSYPDGRHEY
jgi:hypothetical protein